MDYTGLFGVLAAIGIPTIGGILATGKLLQMVKDHDREIQALRTDVELAQNAAQQVAGLAAAIEHMGDKFATEVKHLVDRMADRDEHTRTQLSDIKEQLRQVSRGRPRAQAE